MNNTVSTQEYKGKMKKHADVQYLKLAKRILEQGSFKDDRTGTGTLSLFGQHLRFDLQEGFPLLTTKKVNFDALKRELLWFLKGETNIKSLVDDNVNIWNADAHRMYNSYADGLVYPELSLKEFVESIKTDSEFAEAHGDLGDVYGAQWRRWKATDTLFGDEYTIDQISSVIEGIMKNPNSRRHIVSAWNVAEIENMALPPCHLLFQFYVADGKLSCILTQRSSDTFLGLPFNIASYALLTHMVAQVTGLEVGELVINIGDAHIYANHIEQMQLQLTRMPRELPVLKLNPEIDDIFEFTAEDIQIEGYNPHGIIKGAVSVGV